MSKQFNGPATGAAWSIITSTSTGTSNKIRNRGIAIYQAMRAQMIGLALTTITTASTKAVLGAIPALAWTSTIVVYRAAIPTSQLSDASSCIVSGAASISQEVGGNVYFAMVPSAQGKRGLAPERNRDRGPKIYAVSGESTHLVGIIRTVGG
tara:strand:- start:287 stop:742 length:456 start_codon:yes stop_codon:yes gene_type:complete